jgi:hypothetical protein
MEASGGPFTEGPSTPWVTSITGESMKNTTQVYVLTLNAPSKKTVRLWTGTSIHSLRHCSSKKIDRTLAEMQQHVDDLQRAITVLATGGSYSINRSR